MVASLDDYRTSLLQFAQRVPDLLTRHGATTKYAVDVSSLELRQQLEQRHFTVALLGRMKSGKSTLLNALLEKRLAPVGVNEMTATVNWFDHGEGESEGNFEIHWKDNSRRPEVRPIDAMLELSGTSKEAVAIDHIRFLSNSSFLRGVRLIDAPGTMSTLDSHEAATMNMITHQYGAKADATVLVLPTVVSQSDEKILQEFAEQTRLPGQGPYNTLAVFQKWESLNHREPEKAAWDLARNFKDRLRREVSDVIPVSGLLSIFARTVQDESMDRLAFLASRTATPDLERLTANEARFSVDRDGVALDGAERTALFADVRKALLGAEAERAAGTFEMVKFALSYANRHGISSASTLRSALADISNIDRLREILDRRFCAVSGLIQAGSVLKKALDPCRSAVFALRDELERRRAIVAEGQQALQSQGSQTPASVTLRSYVEATIPLIQGEMAPIDTTLRELDMMVHSADGDFRLLMNDIAFLSELSERPDMLPPDREVQARHLFGQHGFDVATRLNMPIETGLADLHAKGEMLHQAFFELRGTSRLAQHAEERLSRLLSDIEAQMAA